MSSKEQNESRQMIALRQAEGIAAAKAKGMHLGSPTPERFIITKDLLFERSYKKTPVSSRPFSVANSSIYRGRLYGKMWKKYKSM